MKDIKKIELNAVPVLFDQEAHTYTNTLTGDVYQGITGTLIKRVFPDKYKGIPEAILRKAAERGTMVHEEIELAESIGIEPTTDEARNYLSLKAENNLVYVAGEYTVSDLQHYATNIDGIYDDGNGGVILADYKTTSKFDKESVSWQLSICANFFEMNNPELKVSRLIGIWLRDNIAEVIEVTRKSDDDIKRLIEVDQADGVWTDERQLPEYFSEVEGLLEVLERRIKALSAERDTLKAELLEAMEEHGDESFDTGGMLVTYCAPSKRSTFDSTRFKKEQPELYKEYVKTGETKSTLRITIR